MTTPDRRDRAIDALLRRQLADEAEPSSACLDAETLAAWMDGGLDAHALAQAEEHAAGCARCQAMMATLVKGEPAPEVVASEPVRGWWSWRWLVPLTAAAAATLVWLVVPGDQSRTTLVEQESTQARAEAPAPPSSPPSAPVAGTPAEAPPASADAPTVGAERRQQAAKQVAGGEAPSVRYDAVAGERRSAEAVAQTTPPAAPAAGAPRAAAANAVGALTDSAVALEIDSRDPSVQWRLAGPGAVERSTDGGASWSRLETGIAATLTAGSAPSASVCWLVGRGGVVLLTTDARTWRRVTSPTAENLGAVDATDATTATVRTSTGASFRTTDGGLTWVATP